MTTADNILSSKEYYQSVITDLQKKKLIKKITMFTF